MPTYSPQSKASHQSFLRDYAFEGASVPSHLSHRLPKPRSPFHMMETRHARTGKRAEVLNGNYWPKPCDGDLGELSFPAAPQLTTTYQGLFSASLVQHNLLL